MELRLHHFGMIALDGGGAGDCFFRAVLHQLYVNPNSHGIIRVAGVELLREKLKDLLKVIFEHSWIQYLVCHVKVLGLIVLSYKLWQMYLI